MQSRVLAHGRAPRSTTTSATHTYERGSWSDLTREAQFLIDLEFLARHSLSPAQLLTKRRASVETSCIYAQTPPYLDEISRRFPWIHFYAFNRPLSEVDEYDPAQPEIVKSVDFTLQTDQNKTTSPFPFNKDSATMLSKNKQAAPDRQCLLMICHGESPTRQMILHTLVQADYSLLDIGGAIPAEYLEGELVLPIFLPNRKIFACLIVYATCKAKQYDPKVFQEEIGMMTMLPLLLYNHTDFWCVQQISSKTRYARQKHTTETVVHSSSMSTPNVFTRTLRATRLCS